MGLKQQAISGVKWKTIGTVTSLVLQIMQLAVLARLLSISDFGLIALSSIVTGFSSIFIDMGISNAIIYKQDISEKQLHSLYWFNIFSGAAVFLIIALTSALISSLFGNDLLQPIIVLSAVSFLISPFGQQFRILLQKELHFSTMVKIELLASTVFFITSILTAFFGYGVFSYIFAGLLSTSVSTFFYIKMGTQYHKVKPYFKFREIRSFLAFGLFQVGDNFVNYFNGQVDVLLVGKFLGFETLGLYNVAKQLILRPAQIINPVITTVSFPVMAKVQNDVKQLKHIYLKTILNLSSVNFPIYGFLFFFAEEITLALYGQKWLSVVPIIKILSIWGALRSTGNPVGSLLLARGKARLSFLWNLALLLIVPPAVIFVSSFGIHGIAFTLVILMAVLTIPGWYFLIRSTCHATLPEYYWQIIKPACITIASYIIGYFSAFYISEIPLKSAVNICVVICMFLFFNYVFNRQFIVLLTEFLPKGKISSLLQKK